MKMLSLRLVAALALSVSATCIQAASYQFTELTAPGYTELYATGINSVGQVAGAGGGPDGVRKALLWTNGSAVELKTSPGTESFASGINDKGAVVGYEHQLSTDQYLAMLWDASGKVSLPGLNSLASAVSNKGGVVGGSDVDGNGSSRAIFWSNGKTRVLKSLGGAWENARAINGRNDIVGSGQIPGSTTQHALLWKGGKVTDLGILPNGSICVATGINDAGTVVGYGDFFDAEGYGNHAVMWKAGVMTELSQLPGENGKTRTYARAINKHGVIVGLNNSAYGGRRAVVWSHGMITDLNDLLDPAVVEAGWILRDARGINDKGQIIGTALNWKRGEYSEFLLSK